MKGMDSELTLENTVAGVPAAEGMARAPRVHRTRRITAWFLVVIASLLLVFGRNLTGLNLAPRVIVLAVCLGILQPVALSARKAAGSVVGPSAA